MLLAYAYCFGSASERPELCIIPSKPDQFSCLVRVHSLLPTSSAICRLSPSEGIKVFTDPEPDSLIIEPITPSKLFLTPSQADRPGLEVRQVRVKFYNNSEIDISFRQSEKDTTFKPWRPNESTIS